MSTAIKGLRKLQIGKELTRGTPVAASRRLYVVDGESRHIRDQDNHDDEINGTLARAQSKPTIWREHTEMDFTFPLDYDQILLPLLAGVKGGVTPSTPGTGEARLWTFVPSVTADPVPDAYTLEYAAEDGTNSDADESEYGICTGFEISAPDEGLSQAVVNLEARKARTTTVTAALAVPTTLERIPVGLWTLEVDDTFAGLGTTKIVAQASNFKIAHSDFIRPERYHDGRPNLDFSKYEYSSGRLLDLTFDVLVDPNGGFSDAERVKKDTGELRFIRMEALGPAFASPDDSLFHMVRFEGAFVHDEDSMSSHGADRDGLEMVSMHLLSTYDPTGAQDWQCAVQNKIATFP